MTDQPAIAKISAPRLFGVVRRERLFAHLMENRGRPLIWIDGPPGSGKTTLVASYLESSGLPALWYQVDDGDVDPGNLFHYLRIAASMISGAVEINLPGFLPEHSTDLYAFARTFFRQLFLQLPPSTVLVLDNYQEMQQESAFHAALSCAVAEVPPGGSIVCVSRSGPPPTFFPIVASGAFCSMHWEMLRLTLEETRAMSTVRGALDEGIIRSLHQQSEGWAAGVTLMLEGMSRGSAEVATAVSDNKEEVFTYFASLLFDLAPEEVRHTLEAIAFLPHVTPSLARRLTENNSAGELLEQLYRRQLFIDRRPGPEPIYQFHALFRDFLRARAHLRLDAKQLLRLKCAAAEALRANGSLEEAMELWRSTENWREAIHTIAQAADDLLRSGRRQTLENWIAVLPASVREADSWIVYWQGMAHVQIAPELGIERLRSALAMMKRQDNAQGVLMCVTALLNAAFLGYFAVEAVDGWLDELLGEVTDLPVFASVDLELRFWGGLCSALFWTRPTHPWTGSAVQRIEPLLSVASDPNAALAAASSALTTTALTGDFECGDRIFAATEHLLSRSGGSPAEMAWWLNRASYLRFMQARYDESLGLLERAGQLAETSGMSTLLATTVHHRFMVQFRVSGWAAADATLARMEAMPRPTNPVMEAMLHVYRARRAQFRGRHDEAADLAELTHAAILRTGSQYQEMLFGMVDGELLLDAGRVEKAQAMIARSAQLISQAEVFDTFKAALALVEARLAQVEGNMPRALERCRHALNLAKVRNRRYMFRYLECSMPRVFMLALQSNIEVQFVQQLVRMFRLKSPMGAPSNWPWQVRILTLGTFQVFLDDEPLQFPRKVPKKTLALLKTLIAHGGSEVTDQALCDALWGDEEADAARQALSITIVRLRKLLGGSQYVIQHGGKLSLERTLCWVDCWEFEERSSPPVPKEAIAEVLDLYKGAFLPADEGDSWSVTMRERLRGRFIHLLATHGYHLEASGDALRAIDLYLRGIDADPVVEAFWQGIMRCYARLGRHTEAVSAYRRMRHTMSVVLGLPPSKRSRELFEEIRALCADDTEQDPAVIVPLDGSLSGAGKRARRAR